MTTPDTAAKECGYCKGYGYTIKTVLGTPGIAVECSECNGVGKVTAPDAYGAGSTHQRRLKMESDTVTDLPPVDAVVEVAFRGRVAVYNDDYNGTVSVEVLAEDGRSLGYYANAPREAVWIADEHAGGA